MADKLLKSITFPDLTDKYIIGDTSLSVAGAGADAKATGDALATKANVDGSYESMTVGNAEQLVSNVRVNDKTPYLFRTSGGSVDIGDREYVNGIVGGTVAWNQLNIAADLSIPNVTNYYSVAGGTLSLNNGVLELAINETPTETWKCRIQRSFSSPALSHKFLVTAVVTLSKNGSVNIYAGQAQGGRNNISITANQYKEISTVVNISTAGLGAPSVSLGSDYANFGVGDTFYLKSLVWFDLTQMFGSTIADYIYSLETATAGAGVAFFKKLFPKPYYAYNAGELKSVSGLVSHDMTGFNQWDEEWEVGQINTATGENQSANDRIRSKNYIPCFPNTVYGYSFPSYAHKATGDINVCFYDADKTFIKCEGWIITSTFTTPQNAHFIRFFVNGAYGTTYGHDICINISWDGSRNGEYEPYELHSYPLDTDLTLRGIPKLDANNNLYYDGDTYESDGTVTRKYGIVDLGTLTWTYGGVDSTHPYGFFYSTSLERKAGATNLVCSKYVTQAGWTVDKVISGHTSYKNLYVVDSAYTDATAFKTAMSGVYLVYELATPTTEQADPYQQVEIVSDFGTEEFVIDDDVFAIPVGHNTDYPMNLVAKLEMAPNSPSGDGDYLVRQNNGTNEYVSIASNATIQDMLARIEALENA